jgi:hypothetical protein
MASAKVILCGYTSKISSLTGDKFISDKLIIDTNVGGVKFDEPLVTKALVDNSVLKIFSSGEDKHAIAISLTLKNAGTVIANSSDSSGNMKSAVHLDHVGKSDLGARVFTSVRCEFAD